MIAMCWPRKYPTRVSRITSIVTPLHSEPCELVLRTSPPLRLCTRTHLCTSVRLRAGPTSTPGPHSGSQGLSSGGDMEAENGRDLHVKIPVLDLLLLRRPLGLLESWWFMFVFVAGVPRTALPQLVPSSANPSPSPSRVLFRCFSVMLNAEYNARSTGSRKRAVSCTP
ncbi:hypothetical protein NDU88_000206 [Pleurodeles waltl]|uniref:Uncharacterized protein n=1 Tax=Pleurodeles waltl TaxID=8319 RepID=A0AAV7TF61_PLEWA|nr:hypothetical protein NDU88_000206 [Pleurodeles waltl]